MSNLFSLNPASDGAAASLFTDERTANARAKVNISLVLNKKKNK